MNQHQLSTVRASFAHVEPCGPAFLTHALLQARRLRPNLDSCLSNDDLAGDAQRLYDTLRAILRQADRFETLEQPLGVLGARAERSGLTTADLLATKDQFIRCLRDAMPNQWTREAQNAWSLLLDAVVGALVAGAEAARSGASIGSSQGKAHSTAA